MGAFGGEYGRGGENQVAYVRRRKSGLEVPLTGRFFGENKLLLFAPPLWHDALVGICILGGAVYTLLQLVNRIDEVPGGYFTTVAILLAGIWGAVSNERMICDLRGRTYTRFEGMGPGRHVIRGNLNELDALVLTAEQYAHGTGFGAPVIYRLVLYWKGQRHPALVIERERKSLRFGSPLNAGAGRLLAKGARVAQALQIPYYDNSHISGKSPVPIV